MANGDIDYKARKELDELKILHGICRQSRETKEVELKTAIDKNTDQTASLKESVDQLAGGIKAWKILIPLFMLVLAAMTFLVNAVMAHGG